MCCRRVLTKLKIAEGPGISTEPTPVAQGPDIPSSELWSTPPRPHPSLASGWTLMANGCVAGSLDEVYAVALTPGHKLQELALGHLACVFGWIKPLDELMEDGGVLLDVEELKIALTSQTNPCDKG